jgi:hypothetical protein
MRDAVAMRGVGAVSVGERRLKVVPTCPETSRMAKPRDVPMRIRINRRGRLVLRVGLALVIMLLVVAAVLVWPRPASAGQGSAPMRVRYHVVLPGETLWGLAATVDSDSDPRDVVAELVSLNALQSPSLRVGQRVALPAS